MAGDDAQDRARQVGITLRPSETWVKAHIRGVPDSIEMRFRWYAPTELKLLNAPRSIISELAIWKYNRQRR